MLPLASWGPRVSISVVFEQLCRSNARMYLQASPYSSKGVAKRCFSMCGVLQTYAPLKSAMNTGIAKKPKTI